MLLKCILSYNWIPESMNEKFFRKTVIQQSVYALKDVSIVLIGALIFKFQDSSEFYRQQEANEWTNCLMIVSLVGWINRVVFGQSISTLAKLFNLNIWGEFPFRTIM